MRGVRGGGVEGSEGERNGEGSDEGTVGRARWASEARVMGSGGGGVDLTKLQYNWLLWKYTEQQKKRPLIYSYLN